MGGAKPQVTLTLAADEKKLVDSFDKAGKASTDMAQKVDSASRDATQAGKRFDDVAGSADKAGKSFGGMSDDLGKASGAMVAKAALIGASIVGALGSMMAQANIGGMLAAQLGGGSERAGELGKLAGKIYANNFGDSIQDVGEALKGVIGTNLISEDAVDADIQRITEKLLTVGQVMQEETAAVSRAVQQMIRTGMVKNAEEGFDLLVRAQQQGLNSSQDLLDTFNEYGTQFRKLGLDGPKAMGLISQAIKGGARDADIAADAIKEFSIRSIDGSEATADAMKRLFGGAWEKVVGDISRGGPKAAAAFDAVLDKLRLIKSPADQAALSVALFGTQAEDLGAALLKMDPTTAVDALGQVAGATDQAMAAIGDTPEAKFEAFKRNMETKMIDMLLKAAPLLEKVMGFVSQFSDVLGPLAIAIGVVTVAQWLWNAATAASPWFWIITGIVALVAAFVMLWNKSEGFRAFFIGMWEGIKSFVVGVWEAIPGAAKTAMNFVIGIVNSAINGINKILDGVNWATKFVGIPAIPHIPNIPRLHTGGIFHASGGEGLAMLRDGERVTPAGQQGGGGPYPLTVDLVEQIQGWLNDGRLVLVGR